MEARPIDRLTIYHLSLFIQTYPFQWKSIYHCFFHTQYNLISLYLWFICILLRDNAQMKIAFWEWNNQHYLNGDNYVELLNFYFRTVRYTCWSIMLCRFSFQSIAPINIIETLCMYNDEFHMDLNANSLNKESFWYYLSDL